MKSSNVSARSSPVKCVERCASDRSGISITPDICCPYGFIVTRKTSEQ